MMGMLGGSSNTLIFGGDGPGDMRKVVAELATVRVLVFCEHCDGSRIDV
jgi:hypothetical protein